jgi:hypothetical protein
MRPNLTLSSHRTARPTNLNAASNALRICFRKGWHAVRQATILANPHVRKFIESPHHTSQLGDQTGGALAGVRVMGFSLDHMVTVGKPTWCWPTTTPRPHTATEEKKRDQIHRAVTFLEHSTTTTSAGADLSPDHGGLTPTLNSYA